MRPDGSLDDQIKTIEKRIGDRRVALRDSVDDLAQQARMLRQRARQKAGSPIVWGGALALGFVAARLARSAHAHRKTGWRSAARKWRNEEKPVSTGRQVLGAVLSAAVPIALRVARHSAAPWIARQVNAAQQAYARRRAYQQGYSRY